MPLHHQPALRWKDVSSKGVFNGNLRRFSDWMSNAAPPAGLPFFLFTNDLSGIEKHLSHLAVLQPAVQGVVVVSKGATKNGRDLWNLPGLPLYDVLEWTTEDELLAYAHSLAARTKAITDVLNSPLVLNNLIGESPVWKGFLRNITETALFSTASVLLIGQSGTGKELVSRLIHTLDKRPGKKELVLVDCTTIVPELSGSEFFGHEKGSYTNAIQTREGAFAMANGGTLFLDEAGELPLPLQAELLRVIQEGTYKKVGGNVWQKTAFRLVCATNRNLRQQVKESRFRQDLYFRISDFEFAVPALKERIEDIPLLANSFLKEFLPQQDVEFDDSVMEYLVNREYTGNVRELRQVVRRISLRHMKHRKITMGEVPAQDRTAHNGNGAAANGETLRSSLRKAILSGYGLCDLKNMTMEEAIQIALDLCNGNKEQAAKKLGVTWRAILQFRKKNGSVKG